MVNYKIDWDSVDSLENWVETLDLMCVPEEKLTLVSTIHYFGTILGCILFSRVPDVYGRKWPLAYMAAIQVPVYLAVILNRSLTLAYPLAFILGFLRIGIYNGCYVDICEYVQTKYKNKVCTILLVFDMITLIISGIYWRYITKNWLGLQLFGLSLNVIAAVGLFFIPESPEFLYCFYRFAECRAVLQKIAKLNNKDDKTDRNSDLKATNAFF